MTGDDLAEVLGRQERDNLEFKSRASNRRSIRKAICALANDLPGRREGHLLIGVDSDGRSSGLKVTDELLREIAGFRNDGLIVPPIALVVQEASFDDQSCVLVTVPAAASPPVKLEGRIWVRAGTSTREASREEERLLVERRRHMDRPFEQHPVHGSTVRDLDLALFESTYRPAAIALDTIAANNRTVDEQLAALRLLDPTHRVPTVLGHLLVGFDPSAWIPGAYLQFVRYDGTEASAPVQDHDELRGNLVLVLAAIGRLLPANIHASVRDVAGLRQLDAPDYPLAALREIVVNALMHRTYESSNAPVRVLWYTDRVEVTSPGGPFGVVTSENFDRRNDYRNPGLAAAMKDLGYVNRFGRGIELVRGALKANGNLPAVFSIEQTYWSVTVRGAR